MGLISRMVIVRPPCSWAVVAIMSLPGMTNGSLGGSGGGGVPSGIFPMMRAVGGKATGTSCERTRSEPTRAVMSARGSGFMEAVGSIRSFLVDGELEEPHCDDRNGL